MKAEIPQAPSTVRGMTVRGIKPKHSSAVHSLAALSAAQRIVLRGIALGQKPNQIAAELPAALRVSERGVIYHRREIYRKLGIHSIAEATRVAITAGLL